MQPVRKLKTISRTFSAAQIAAAKATVAPPALPDGIDWSRGVVTSGGGVAATIDELRRTRGKNRNPTKEQVAIRFDANVLAAFRAGGPGWQTRMNNALKEWLDKQHPISRRRKVAHVSPSARDKARVKP